MSGLCYNRESGRLYYAAGEHERVPPDGGLYRYVVGELSEPPSQHEPLTPPDKPGTWGINPFSCDHMRKPEVVAANEGWTPLKPEHGYLHYPRPVDEHNWRYYSEMRDEWVVLSDDFTASASMNNPLWVAYRDAYFFPRRDASARHHQQLRAAGDCWTGLWLAPDGDLSEECIPTGPWTEYGLTEVDPYRRGYLYVVRSVSDIAGIYVHNGETGYKLIDGLAKRPVVSPDGCHAVFKLRWRPLLPSGDKKNYSVFYGVSL